MHLSPLDTHLNLDEKFEPAPSIQGMFCGQYVGVTDTHDSAVADLLDHVRFRFDNRWAKYYAEATRHEKLREIVGRQSLSTVSCDIPLLLAFFLLLNAKGATRPVPIKRATLNRKRLARQYAPLLDHVEVHSSLAEFSCTQEDYDEDGAAARRAPRLHHVRGHLVKRENRVFWRMAHLRGHLRQGQLRSRTVNLSFCNSQAA